MKKTYITPILKMENAEPASLLCESFYGNNDTLTPGGGSDGEARAPEIDWNIWGDE